MLSFCELNLEIWRQLWRVLEISDIVLVIVDARTPVRRKQISDVNMFKSSTEIIILLIVEFTVPALTVRICQKYAQKGHDFGVE